MSSTNNTEQIEPMKIGGWLILLAVGLVLSPIRIIINLLTSHVPLFENGSWALLTKEGSNFYTPNFDVLFIGELLGNIACVLLSIYLLYLFFRRQKSFPKWYVAVATFTLVFVIVDSLAVSWVMTDVPFWDKETVQAIATCLFSLFVWGTYLFQSERSKNTFIMNSGKAAVNMSSHNNVNMNSQDGVAEQNMVVTDSNKSGPGWQGIVGMILGIIIVKVLWQMMN